MEFGFDKGKTNTQLNKQTNKQTTKQTHTIKSIHPHKKGGGVKQTEVKGGGEGGG
jgi:hypothetical protein